MRQIGLAEGWPVLWLKEAEVYALLAWGDVKRLLGQRGEQMYSLSTLALHVLVSVMRGPVPEM
jgi:hypothetical protein